MNIWFKNRIRAEYFSIQYYTRLHGTHLYIQRQLRIDDYSETKQLKVPIAVAPSPLKVLFYVVSEEMERLHIYA